MKTTALVLGSFLSFCLVVACGSSDSGSSDSPNGGSGAGGSSPNDGGAGGGGFDGSTVQPGTPATVGTPTSTLFNGLRTVADKSPYVPDGATAAFVADMPAPLAAAPLPYVPDVKSFVRRDSVVLSFANVAGAADYRAYVVDSNVTFTQTTNGVQPRGAVVACAGYRQHTYQSEVVDGHHSRELLQSIELPGLVGAGNYVVVLEATSSPCPFVGLPSLVDAQITEGNNGTTSIGHVNSPEAYLYTGIPMVKYESFASRLHDYGNVILNGQGASISYDQRETVPWIGEPVPPNDATIPSDPVVIARSALTIPMPTPEANPNVPSFDVGPHSLTDEFAADNQADPAAMSKNPDYGTTQNAYNDFSINPLFHMNTWQFWGRFMQAPDETPGTQSYNFWSTQALTGVQAFTRYGRLYTTFGDDGEDVGGTLGFASLTAPIVQMDSQQYVHSVFRMNSEASHRRYWWWTICGGDTSDELFDPTGNQFKVRPLVFETTFGPGGNNPTVPDGHTLSSTTTPDDAVGVAKECLSITEEGRPEDSARTDGTPQSSAVVRAQIHPKNKSHGIIALGNSLSDTPVAGGEESLGFRYRVDAGGNRVGTMIEPYDQLAPLAQYDVFVRPDRLVVFIDNRFGFCVDMSDVALSMKYAFITYGDLLYHSSIEYQELSNGAVNQNAQLYQVLLNAPIASSRTWDVIGHADHVDFPAQLGTLDTSLCRKPSNAAVQ